MADAHVAEGVAVGTVFATEYRDIRQVIEDQQDLVIKKLRLEPLAVFKG